jgi:hypothetical protein
MGAVVSHRSADRRRVRRHAANEGPHGQTPILPAVLSDDSDESLYGLLAEADDLMPAVTGVHLIVGTFDDFEEGLAALRLVGCSCEVIDRLCAARERIGAGAVLATVTLEACHGDHEH